MDNFHRQTTAGQATVAPLLMPPQVEGYRTERLLGSGACASVWLIREPKTGQARALKVFAASGNHETARAEMGRELAILGRLSHAHLLDVGSVLATDQGPALLMTYAAGGSLRDVVGARGRLSVGETVTVLTPIAQAVAYLHSESVLHGDLSPGNVLLTAEGKPLLADLGIGRLAGESNAGAEGTPGFIDPSEGTAARLNLARDVYSLAALGWYCLTGQVAGPAQERPPLTLIVPEVPADLLSVVEAGLHTDPDQRPTAAEFAHAVLKSATPRPLDLVQAVHPTVRPELLTRRAARQPAPTRNKRLGIQLRLPRLRTAGHPQPRTGPRRWPGVLLGVSATVLVVIGAVIAGPSLAEAIGQSRGDDSAGSTGAAAEPESPDNAGSGAETESDTDGLSPEMQSRLADADELVVLPALAAVRAKALSSGDELLLHHVNVDGSDTMAADQGIIAALRARNQVFDGLSVQLQNLKRIETPAKASGGSPVSAVAATVVTSAYTVLEGGGTSTQPGQPVDSAQTAETVEEATTQELVFLVERHEGLWKIASVHVADPA